MGDGTMSRRTSGETRPTADGVLLNFTNLVLIDRVSRAAFPIIEGRPGLPARIEVEQPAADDAPRSPQEDA